MVIVLSAPRCFINWISKSLDRVWRKNKLLTNWSWYASKTAHFCSNLQKSAGSRRASMVVGYCRCASGRRVYACTSFVKSSGNLFFHLLLVCFRDTYQKTRRKFMKLINWDQRLPKPAVDITLLVNYKVCTLAYVMKDNFHNFGVLLSSVLSVWSIYLCLYIFR